MSLFSARPIKVDDYRRLAQRRLPKMVFDYLEGGAEDETGIAHNRAVFERYRFKPRRLTDVSRRSLAIELFGKTLSAPLMIAPTGFNGLLWPKGDLMLAQAAARAGIPFILSTASSESIETIAKGSSGDRWFQLYVIHPELADTLVNRALEAEYSTLVLTTDVGVHGYRERDLRNGFGLPIRCTPKVLVDGALHPRWSFDLLRHGVPQLANLANAQSRGTTMQAAMLNRQMDASYDWDDLRRLRDRWPRKLLVKGLLDPRDVEKCAALGVDGVILSNHGGRHLDSALSPMDVLASTMGAAGVTVLADSGFRRGADVVKALALGARGVLLGRATLYGLAARGSEGVDDIIRMMKDEIDRTLAQIGCASVSDLSSDYLVPMKNL